MLLLTLGPPWVLVWAQQGAIFAPFGGPRTRIRDLEVIGTMFGEIAWPKPSQNGLGTKNWSILMKYEANNPKDIYFKLFSTLRFITFVIASGRNMNKLRVIT